MTVIGEAVFYTDVSARVSLSSTALYEKDSAGAPDEEPPSNAEEDILLSGQELNRLRWRSRRGMLELDLLLLPFFDEVFRDLPESEQQVFGRLLEQEDPDLLQWFSRRATPDDPELASMVKSILRRVQP